MARYQQQRLVPYEASFLYGIAADVECYPLFVPWCREVRILERHESSFVALVTFGTSSLHYQFRSYDFLYPPAKKGDAYRIEASSDETPFKHLFSQWIFTPHQEGCALDFTLEYELRSSLLSLALAPMFDEATQKMMTAFEERAHSLSLALSLSSTKQPQSKS